MKIAFDHQIFSAQRYGGVSRYFIELACRLRSQQESDVGIYSAFHCNEYLAAGSASGLTRARYVPRDFEKLPSLLESVNRAAAPFVWRHANPDILHETYFSVKPVGRGRRRVVTVYDMIHEMFMPHAESDIAAKRATIDRADHVICISESTRQDLIRVVGVEPARTSVVHLGYSIAEEPRISQQDRVGYRPSILYVGKRAGYKNFGAVLQGLSTSGGLRDFELVAFGGGPFRSEELQDIERFGLNGRVRFETGSDAALAAAYRSAAAFVYPSQYEGFGLPPLEAMNFGCPVVCSNAGAIPEVVGDAGVYFDPNNAEELREALENVVMSEELQADLQARGHTRVAAFSWDRCAAETAKIYRNLS